MKVVRTANSNREKTSSLLPVEGFFALCIHTVASKNHRFSTLLCMVLWIGTRDQGGSQRDWDSPFAQLFSAGRIRSVVASVSLRYSHIWGVISMVCTKVLEHVTDEGPRPVAHLSLWLERGKYWGTIIPARSKRALHFETLEIRC